MIALSRALVAAAGTQPSSASIGIAQARQQCATMSVLKDDMKIRVLWTVNRRRGKRGKGTRWYHGTVVSTCQGPTGPTAVVQYDEPSGERSGERWTHDVGELRWEPRDLTHAGACKVAPTAAETGAPKAPAAPCKRKAPAAPCKPKAPAAPCKPKAPAAPCKPKAPAAPCERKAPAAPCERKAPAAPCKRRAPAAPCKRKAPAAPQAGVLSPAANAGSGRKVPRPSGRRDPDSGGSEGGSEGGPEGVGADTCSPARATGVLAADASVGWVSDGAVPCTCTAAVAPPAGVSAPAASAGSAHTVPHDSERCDADSSGSHDGGAPAADDTGPAFAGGLACPAPAAAGARLARPGASDATAAAATAAAAAAPPGACSAGIAPVDPCDDRHLGPVGVAREVQVTFLPYSESGEVVARTGYVTCARSGPAYVVMVVIDGSPVTAHNLETGNWALYPDVVISSPDQLSSPPPGVAKRRLEALMTLCKLREDTVMARVLGLAALHAQAEACAKAVAMSSDPTEGDRVDARRAFGTYLTERVQASRAAGY